MILLKSDTTRSFYLCDEKDLPKIKVSSLNRGADTCRIQEIMKSYNNSVLIPSGFIETFKSKDTFYCIDGGTRITSIKAMVKIEPYRKVSFILSVLNNPTKELIRKEFKRINEGILVPDVYLEENDEAKNIILPIVKNLKKRYPSFFKPSRNPHKPNINRDVFTDLLSDIYKKHKFDNQILEDINKDLSLLYQQDTSKVIEKCKKYNFYLGILEKSDLHRKIQEKITRKDLVTF